MNTYKFNIKNTKNGEVVTLKTWGTNKNDAIRRATSEHQVIMYNGTSDWKVIKSSFRYAEWWED